MSELLQFREFGEHVETFAILRSRGGPRPYGAVGPGVRFLPGSVTGRLEGLGIKGEKMNSMHNQELIAAPKFRDAFCKHPKLSRPETFGKGAPSLGDPRDLFSLI